MTGCACSALVAVTVREWVVSVAAIVGVVVAIVGLTAWRNEIRGKTEYALARRLLRAAYDVLEAIKGVRVPAIFAGEIEQSLAKRPQESGPAEEQAARIQYVYEDRWARVQDAVARLRSETLEAQVLWGTEFGQVVEPLHGLVVDLAGAIAVMLASQRGEKVPVKLVSQSDPLVYSTSSDRAKDPFLDRLLTAVGAIETELRPHLLARQRRRRRKGEA